MVILNYALKGRILKFDGFLRVQASVQKKNEGQDLVLPDVKPGEVLNLEKVEPSQHFTKPSPRYTEASLVKELEKRSIGRPSTYATIISTIQDRGYVKNEQRRFFCLKMGDIVTIRLVESFHKLMDYSFTANLEEELDEIAAGKKPWTNVLDTFYKEFLSHLKEAEETMRGVTL